MKAAKATPGTSTPWSEVHLPQGVLLRDIADDDAPGLHRIHGNPLVYAHDLSETHPHLEYTRAFLAPFRAHSHNAHRVTGANPASQPQANRHEDLQAVHLLPVRDI